MLTSQRFSLIVFNSLTLFILLFLSTLSADDADLPRTPSFADSKPETVISPLTSYYFQDILADKNLDIYVDLGFGSGDSDENEFEQTFDHRQYHTSLGLDYRLSRRWRVGGIAQYRFRRADYESDINPEGLFELQDEVQEELEEIAAESEPDDDSYYVVLEELDQDRHSLNGWLGILHTSFDVNENLQVGGSLSYSDYANELVSDIYSYSGETIGQEVVQSPEFHIVEGIKSEYRTRQSGLELFASHYRQSGGYGLTFEGAFGASRTVSGRYREAVSQASISEGFGQPFDDLDSVFHPLLTDFKERSFDSVTTRISMRFSRVFSTERGVFIPYLGLSWHHEFKHDPRTIEFQFFEPYPDPDEEENEFEADVGGEEVEVDVDELYRAQIDGLDSDYFPIRIGLQWVGPHGWNGYIDYRQTLGREDLSEGVLTVGFRIER